MTEQESEPSFRRKPAESETPKPTNESQEPKPIRENQHRMFFHVSKIVTGTLLSAGVVSTISLFAGFKNPEEKSTANDIKRPEMDEDVKPSQPENHASGVDKSQNDPLSLNKPTDAGPKEVSNPKGGDSKSEGDPIEVLDPVNPKPTEATEVVVKPPISVEPSAEPQPEPESVPEMRIPLPPNDPNYIEIGENDTRALPDIIDSLREEYGNGFVLNYRGLDESSHGIYTGYTDQEIHEGLKSSDPEISSSFNSFLAKADEYGFQLQEEPVADHQEISTKLDLDSLGYGEVLEVAQGLLTDQFGNEEVITVAVVLNAEGKRVVLADFSNDEIDVPTHPVGYLEQDESGKIILEPLPLSYSENTENNVPVSNPDDVVVDGGNQEDLPNEFIVKTEYQGEPIEPGTEVHLSQEEMNQVPEPQTYIEPDPDNGNPGGFVANTVSESPPPEQDDSGIYSF